MSRFTLPVAVALLLASCAPGDPKDAPTPNTPASAPSPGYVDQKIENPFPSAAQVRLFVETGFSEIDGTAILSDVDGITLDSANRSKLEHALRLVQAPEEMAACFIPHHFFRYYDHEGKQIGELQVCFCCEGVAATGSNKLLPGNNQIVSADYPALAALVSELGEPTDVLCD